MPLKKEHKAKALIIGGGIIGAALFHELSRQFNGDVILMEKSRFARGATSRSAGIVRAYDNDADLAERGGDSLKFYRQFRAQNPSINFIPTNAIYFQRSEQDSNTPADLAEQLHLQRLTADMPENSTLKINWQGAESLILEPQCGYFDPHAVTNALIDTGRARGGEAMEGVAALSLLTQDDRIIGVETSIGSRLSSVVILCAGAWCEGISRQWRLNLPISARIIQMNSYKINLLTKPYPIFIDKMTGLYGRGDGLNGVLAGMPTGLACHNPDHIAPLDLSHAEAVLHAAKNRFAWASRAILKGGFRAFDAYTEDGRGLISSHPHLRGFFIASGFSGGGFKQAPAVARITATLINQYRSAL